jgi:uncharacterized protein (DUF2235 family)
VAKNIILLSDGTGNSASSPFKTNVWRLYQAVDICPPSSGGLEQIVYYDNGVGTETFKPLQLLGLALGIGVAHNVKNLYTFLCRNYQPGDNIFLFGFSRGAFTVRILAGLLLRCGIVTAPSEDELEQRVKLAYAEYKRDAARRATATRPWLIAGRLLGGSDRGHRIDWIGFKFPQHFPRITFVGVWDTVDAYGMPIDELKEGIDRYVWPMTLADRHLSNHIDRACHALSIDDERPTFRPVLWTDTDDRPERLSQVWFAGVHANVGGGYPDDGLAYVTLQWMMDEAEQFRLRFYPSTRSEYDGRADPNGEQYDSRSGLAGYYRYGPRDMDSLCDDADHGVSIARLQVHDSVLERIRRWQVAYAPICISKRPHKYDVFRRSTAPPVLVRLPPVESAQDVEHRAADMQLVYDAVFRRRLAYLFTVAFTIVLAVLPLFDWMVNHLGPVAAWLKNIAPMIYHVMAGVFSLVAWVANTLSSIPGWSWAARQLGAALSAAKQFAPGWAAFWLDSFARHPALFLFCAAIVLWLFFRKSKLLEDQIFARAEYAWRRILRFDMAATAGKPRDTQFTAPAPAWSDPVVRRLRAVGKIQATYDALTRRFVPMLFAVFVAAPIGAVIWWFFIPKFIRNAKRRRKYEVTMHNTPRERIKSTYQSATAAD